MAATEYSAIAATFGIAILLSGSTNAMAQQADVNAVLHDYDTGERIQRIVLEKTLTNMQSGISVANSTLIFKQQSPLYCPPQTLVMTGPEIVGLLRRGVKDSPLIGKQTVGVAIMMMLEKTFPCRKP
jgi:hypothetical protein